MIQLHYYPSTASMAPHILLRELGLPFELQLVDRTQNAQLHLKSRQSQSPPGLVFAAHAGTACGGQGV